MRSCFIAYVISLVHINSYFLKKKRKKRKMGRRGRESVLVPRASTHLMKGRSSARNAFTYHVAWTTTRARRFFFSLKKNWRSFYFFFHLHA